MRFTQIVLEIQIQDAKGGLEPTHSSLPPYISPLFTATQSHHVLTVLPITLPARKPTTTLKLPFNWVNPILPIFVGFCLYLPNCTVFFVQSCMIKILGSILFRPQLSEHKFFTAPGARAILHSNVLYNNIKFVTGGHAKHWGGGQNIIDPNIAWVLLLIGSTEK